MRRVLALLFLLPAAAAAQLPQVNASAGWALAGYREQGPPLDFRGSGPFVRLDAVWRRWGLTLRGERMAFTPTDPDINAESFHGTETEIALRYRPVTTLPAELEGGIIRRTASPEDAAQGMRLFRLGVVAHFPLGVGAELDTRGAWLVGGSFSGGGSMGTALTLGLRGVCRLTKRVPWAWLVVDYDFRRVDRTTDQPVPIQWSTVRLGLEARLIP